MDKNIKRGIDLQNRFLDDLINKNLQKGKLHFNENPINKITLLALAVILILNGFIASALINKDLTSAFSYSFFLMSIADVVEKIGILQKSQFFLLLSLIMVFWAPVNIYLFVRKITFRSELTAFLATLLFIFPNPVIKGGTPLIHAILQGDGAHAIAFSFVPFFLLHYKAFLSRGLFAWGFLSAVVASVVLLSSPFAFFSLLIMYAIIFIGEGFMGQFRIKLLRLFFILISTVGLSFFWYHPATIVKILKVDSAVFAISYFWNIFPFFIPSIPVVGAIAFLVFDRRQKLQPLFISLFLFVSYLFLYKASSSLNVSGVFEASRYGMELSFSAAFLIAVICSSGFNIIFQKMKTGSFVFKKNVGFFLAIFVATAVIFWIISNGIWDMFYLRSYFISQKVTSAYIGGIGSLNREILFSSFSAAFGTFISFVSLVILFYALKSCSKDVKEIKKDILKI